MCGYKDTEVKRLVLTRTILLTYFVGLLNSINCHFLL